MRVVVLSDTHAPRFWKRCPPAVADQLRTAELILHAGDVFHVSPGVPHQTTVAPGKTFTYMVVKAARQ